MARKWKDFDPVQRLQNQNQMRINDKIICLDLLTKVPQCGILKKGSFYSCATVN